MNLDCLQADQNLFIRFHTCCSIPISVLRDDYNNHSDIPCASIDQHVLQVSFIQINCFVYTPKSQEGVNSCFQGKQCCVHRNFAPYSSHLFVTQIYHANSSQGRVATATTHNRTRMNRHRIEHQLGIPMCINIHSYHCGIRHQQQPPLSWEIFLPFVSVIRACARSSLRIQQQLPW